MPHLVAAPDKFRGTATAHEAAAAIVAAATACGWTSRAVPMSDGGEGFLDVLDAPCATRARTPVRGPLGEEVEAEWALLEDGTAVVESARAAGRALLAAPRGDDPVRASTYGVGQLLAAAAAAGASRIVVGCGGSATTDGGSGCLAALDELGGPIRVPIVAACDVDARFLDAPVRFGPQKGATPTQVRELVTRLDALATAYLDRYGVEVRALPGAGAAGGLAGALGAVGAELVSGARFVAAAVGLDGALDRADLAVTGEGQLDLASLHGKVVGTVLAAAPSLPALVLAGAVEDPAAAALGASRPGRVDVIVLRSDEQRRGTPSAIEAATRRYLAAAT